MKRGKGDTTQVSYWLPTKLVERLRAACGKERPQGQFVAEAIEAKLETAERASRPDRES